MWTRRKLLKLFFWLPAFSLLFDASPLRFASKAWAQAKQVLSKGFPREKLISMNPAEIDSRNLDVDPLDKFGTMGPTDVLIDAKTFRLKVTGKVGRPLSLSLDEILKRPPLTEAVLLICPGFFAYNGQWQGVTVKALIEEAQVKKEAEFVDVKGAHEKVTRISMRNLDQKKIFLAYNVNGTRLPRKHGAPLRLVYEDVYGSDWVKYVDEIEVV
jgi:DMSO/TMAO reductase YedYZ molybdopterin-dependent catalytic subunit